MYRKAFTLLEILLVMVLISILLVILIRLINPDQQIGDINNAQRQADVLSIYTAINQYKDANSGNLPAGITDELKSICKPGCSVSSNKIDISEAIEPYIAFGNIPVDPQQSETLDVTGYTIYVTSQGRVVVSAPLAQNGSTINTLE
jgi:prepilin-type N-terminal cleavage/methylation domain-containing protein